MGKNTNSKSVVDKVAAGINDASTHSFNYSQLAPVNWGGAVPGSYPSQTNSATSAA